MNCSPRWAFPVVALLLLSVCGCSANSPFVYRPAPPARGVQSLPLQVAVLPLKDGTADFITSGSMLDSDRATFNLAKTGISYVIDPLTPELWAKWFAADLAASGLFREARFVYAPPELTDEEIYIEGIVEKAYATGIWVEMHDLALVFHARRRADNQLIWEKTVRSVSTSRRNVFQGCSWKSSKCMSDQLHLLLNDEVRRMFAEARSDLVKTLQKGSNALPTQDHLQTGAEEEAQRLPAVESTDKTIEQILRDSTQ